MAKKVTATKGGLTVVDGYLAVTSARFISFFEIETGVPVKVERWAVEWKLFPSQAEAEVPRNGGAPIEQGQLFLPYVAGNDPVQDGYELVQEALEEKWEVSSATETP
jgi:hypothetical protein